MYSGVPKAGAPDFMSTLEVKVPIMQATPGRTTCRRAMAASASAIDWTTAPAMVTGAMAPASVKGVTITGWPRRAKRMAPSSIGKSCLSGEEELMLVKSRGCALELGLREARGDAGHLDHVLDALGAEAVGVHDLVGEGELLEEAVEVADARRGRRPARPGSRRRRGCS